MSPAAETISVNVPRGRAALGAKYPAMFLRNATAAGRFLGFFTANIPNKNKRRVYHKAACRFAEWCAGKGRRAQPA
jgi:hypothetical protein